MQHQVPWSVLLFASWSRAEELVSMARYRQNDWSSVLKTNRHLEPNRFVLQAAGGKPIRMEGPPMAVDAVVPLIPPSAYHAVTVGDNTSWTFPLAGRLPGLGQGRLVVSGKSAEWTGTSVVWVTHRVDWRAQRLIALSLPRWPMATLYQDGQTPLGLNESRLRNAEASGQHGCLVFVAYALLHVDCLPPSPTNSSSPLKTIGEACRQQAQALVQALILYAHERLQLGQRAEDIFAYLFAKQQTVMAT